MWYLGGQELRNRMTGARIALPLGLAVTLAIAALAIVPRGLDADALLSDQDDPVALADRAVARSFDAAVAAREINAALAANDADLAQSFLELARDRNVPVDPALAEKVERATADAASAMRSVESFTRGLITGEPDDLVGFAGTALGDLFVFGDIRDAVREGTRLASGQEADQLILGLACVGLAVTAGTYASAGVGAPARVGLTVVKAARKTGRHQQPDGGVGRAFGARDRRLVGAAARDRRRQADRARGRDARRAPGGQGREGARPHAACRRCRPGAVARPERAPRSTASSSPKGRATCRGSRGSPPPRAARPAPSSRSPAAAPSC